MKTQAKPPEAPGLSRCHAFSDSDTIAATTIRISGMCQTVGEGINVTYNTHIGSLDSYEKGVIELRDDLKKYAFSNIFEVAGAAKPFERVAVAQNLEYVAEVMRVEGNSPWYAAPHDEFAIVMEGEGRSEEHTSELQLLMRISYAVFCLKKKNNDNTNETTVHKHISI